MVPNEGEVMASTLCDFVIAFLFFVGLGLLLAWLMPWPGR